MQSKTLDKNSKIQLSLAATMFFSPFVKHIINKWHLDISEEDKQFVNWYIRLWYIILWFLLVVVSALVLNYLFPNLILYWVRAISISALLWLLVLGAWWVLGEVKILQKGEASLLTVQEVTTDKSDILFSFIPLYNIYLWYKVHNFERPYRWAKESILLWTLFIVVILLSKSVVISSFVLVVIIIRIASLLSGMDVIDTTIKSKLSKLFLKNPEELWWYVVAGIKYVFHNMRWDNILMADLIYKEKEKYTTLPTILDNFLWVQYIVWFIMFLAWLYFGDISTTSWLFYTIIGLVFGRYAIMYWFWRHLPPLPIAKETTEVSIYIAKYSISKIKKFISSKTKNEKTN